VAVLGDLGRDSGRARPGTGEWTHLVIPALVRAAWDGLPFLGLSLGAGFLIIVCVALHTKDPDCLPALSDADPGNGALSASPRVDVVRLDVPTTADRRAHVPPVVAALHLSNI
jgi:hypothetical protein